MTIETEVADLTVAAEDLAATVVNVRNALQGSATTVLSQQATITTDIATVNAGIATITANLAAIGEMANKVDKVAGKGLSSNDYTDVEKIKLAGLSGGGGGDITGSINFTGTAQRIRFPAVGTPVGNRMLFQSSTVDAATYIGVIPNGTGRSAGITFSNSSDPDNAGYGYIHMSNSEMLISSVVALGTGGTGGLPGAVPLVLTGRAASMSIGDGAVVVKSGTLGYGVGSGGTATQTGSRTSGVVLNKPSGQITLVSAAGSPAWLSFTLTNSSISSADGVVVTQFSGTDLYFIVVTAVATGSCRITFATIGGTTTEQPVFNFQVVKGATS